MAPALQGGDYDNIKTFADLAATRCDRAGSRECWRRHSIPL